MQNTLNTALSDIVEGLRLKRLWVALAFEDIGDQHRLTLLGPIWLLINYLAFAGTFIFIFNAHANNPQYAAYVAIGLFVWFFIMETISNSVSLFSREEAYINGTTLPLTVYVLRMLMQATIRASYALAGCLGILALEGMAVDWAWAYSALGLLLILAVAPAVIIVFAFMGAYFPDSQYVVSNLMRIGMFVTPIFWHYQGSHGVQHAFYFWNPFTYFLEIVRAPVLEGAFPIHAFAICIAIGAIIWVLALLLLGRLRRELVFAL